MQSSLTVLIKNFCFTMEGVEILSGLSQRSLEAVEDESVEVGWELILFDWLMGGRGLGQLVKAASDQDSTKKETKKVGVVLAISK